MAEAQSRTRVRARSRVRARVRARVMQGQEYATPPPPHLLPAGYRTMQTRQQKHEQKPKSLTDSELDDLNPEDFDPESLGARARTHTHTATTAPPPPTYKIPPSPAHGTADLLIIRHKKKPNVKVTKSTVYSESRSSGGSDVEYQLVCKPGENFWETARVSQTVPSPPLPFASIPSHPQSPPHAHTTTTITTP